MYNRYIRPFLLKQLQCRPHNRPGPNRSIRPAPAGKNVPLNPRLTKTLCNRRYGGPGKNQNKSISLSSMLTDNFFKNSLKSAILFRPEITKKQGLHLKSDLLVLL
jgi:hypothetical protein